MRVPHKREPQRGVPAFFERVALHLSSHSLVWPKISETTAVLFLSDTSGIERFGIRPQHLSADEKVVTNIISFHVVLTGHI
ncbi:hypothetical protein Y1Q_0019243 [Alligator mississippiensis]|uniref:Uncharacterized protein n=1 Tax=Alligator mississippiensis TaxID=8496 RepID=A0A151MQH5_ALLMI|nr:hypothetical protein Y1Q_0019243 [Alligator mississippiensis]